MRKRQIFGWFVLLFGIVVLLFSVLYDHHVYLGPLQFIYRITEWFSLGAFFELVVESFESIFDFIGDYFWCLFLIAIGIALVAGARRQRQYEEYQQYSEYSSETSKPHSNRIFCRNLDDMKFAGICSGLAYLFNIDPTIVRIVVLFLGLTSGGTLLLVYIILALILPGEHLGRR